MFGRAKEWKPGPSVDKSIQVGKRTVLCRPLNTDDPLNIDDPYGLQKMYRRFQCLFSNTKQHTVTADSCAMNCLNIDKNSLKTQLL